MNMYKRVLMGFSALAIAVTLIVPAVSFAKEKETKKPKLTETTVIDSRGDDNGLAKYKKHLENKRLKQIEGVVTAITGPVAPSTEGTMVVKKSNGKSYTFTFDSTSATKYTTFLRKHKSTATWNEVMVGDAVHVFTTKLEKGKAVIVWDKGIWYTEVKGTISNLNVDGKAFTLTLTREHVEFTTTVKFDAFTTFMMKDGTAKTSADLANGQTVKIKGTWDMVGKFLLAKRLIIYPVES